MKERRKEGRKERRKEGRKERKKERQKERKKIEACYSQDTIPFTSHTPQ